MDGLGLRLVNSLIQEKNLARLKEFGISPSDLFGDGRIALEWVIDYVNTTKDWPTPKVLYENTSVKLPDEIDSFNYIADVVRKRSLGKKLEEELKDAVTFLEKRMPDEALSRIKSIASGIEIDKSKLKISSYRKTGLDRLDVYKGLKSVGGFYGILTPWETLNNGIQGWVNGTLNVIVARQNVGKSWCLCVIGNECLNQDKNVLFVTLEMTSERMQRRLDAVRYKIPFIKLRDVTFDEDEEEEFEKALKENLTGDTDIIFVDKRIVRRVIDVTHLVMEYNPDVVLIDGGYRFEGTGRGEWEQTKKIVADLQIAAEITNIPWIVTTQYGDAHETGKEIKRGPKMRAWGVRYGKEWVINPDTVIGLHQDEDLRHMNMSEIYVLKMRDAAGRNLGKFKINWKQDVMDFSEISFKTYEPSISPIVSF